MTRARPALLIVSASLTVGACLALRLGWIPRGVPGEWEWPRVQFAPTPWEIAWGTLTVAAFAAFAACGMHALNGAPNRARQSGWLAALVAASIAAQAGVMGGAPSGYGLTKWVALAMPGSSGYFEVARNQMRDPWAFWRAYPRWIQSQDALHVGTHPPGLFLVSRGLLGWMAGHPAAAKMVDDLTPTSVREGFRTMVRPMPRPERAAMVLMAALTLCACAATVVPLYGLARSRLSPADAWACACLWPLTPGAILFAPAADTAFPLIGVSAVALAAWGGGRNALLAGVLLGLGMQGTLAFLAVGLMTGIVLATNEGPIASRSRAILATGIGFLAVTGVAWAISGANPVAIWRVNAANHARFYVEYPRSYAAWTLANPVEAAFAIGWASVAWLVVGLGTKDARPAWAALAVLALLQLSGKNLSEVGRLWLPFFPILLAASGSGMRHFRSGPKTLAATVALLGGQCLALEATVQVVYPF